MVVKMGVKEKEVNKWYMFWKSRTGPAKGKTDFETKEDAQKFADAMNERYGSDFTHWVESEKTNGGKNG
jgi:hypothetical protein